MESILTSLAISLASDPFICRAEADRKELWVWEVPGRGWESKAGDRV